MAEGQKRNKPSKQLNRAVNLLSRQLEECNGCVAIKAMNEIGRSAGISERTMRSAREILQLSTMSAGGKDGYWVTAEFYRQDWQKMQELQKELRSKQEAQAAAERRAALRAVQVEARSRAEAAEAGEADRFAWLDTPEGRQEVQQQYERRQRAKYEQYKLPFDQRYANLPAENREHLRQYEREHPEETAQERAREQEFIRQYEREHDIA